MNEDDTFRELQKISFKEMTHIWCRSHCSVTKTKEDEFFEPYGWTFEEFYKAWYGGLDK